MGSTTYSEGWGKIDETPEDEVKTVETNKPVEEVSDTKPSPENEISE